MHSYDTQYRAAAPLHRLPVVIQVWIRRVHAAVGRLDARIEKRRLARETPVDFRMMSGRELHDIGLTRADAPCVGWDALTEFRNRI
jgi:uncharacterized protein YjiS (DUF1127 family)